uniref:Uncharacterized protein n=1 Tax=Romanomermis culicivorax TaxID=13658 RepID=A0A915JYE6_ROMCU
MLLGTQFRTDHQKKNKEAIMKAIHYDMYCVIRNIAIYPLLYELSWKIELIPEKCMLKAIVSAMWVFYVSRLTLKFLAALHFFNNHHLSFLQTDIIAYATLDAFYPILLFLTFGHYCFILEVYGTPGLYPYDSLEAAEIDN